MQSMQTTTIYWLVVLSIISSSVAAYAGFTFAARAIDSYGTLGRTWLAGASLALGFGIWSTHYLAVLALHPSIDIFFHVPTVLLSLLPSVIASALALWVSDARMADRSTLQPRTYPRIVLAGVILGAGIALTHLIGMSAMRSSAAHTYRPELAGISTLLGTLVSAAALGITFIQYPEYESQDQREWLRMQGALVLGLGVAASDYMGEVAIAFRPAGLAYSTRNTVQVAALGLASIVLTVAVILVGAMVIAIFDRGSYERIQANNRHLRQVRLRMRKSERELREANARLTHLAMIDGLTGIYNRRHFEDALEAEWRRSLRLQQRMAVLLIDIDHFKSLNDTYGHHVGDECLRAVAKSLKSALRRPGDIVARYGGEEFAAILPNSDSGGAMLVAEAVRLAIEGLRVRIEGAMAAPSITVSVGVCSHKPTADGSQAFMIASADKALYRAKADGRNCIRVG